MTVIAMRTAREMGRRKSNTEVTTNDQFNSCPPWPQNDSIIAKSQNLEQLVDFNNIKVIVTVTDIIVPTPFYSTGTRICFVDILRQIALDDLF